MSFYFGKFYHVISNIGIEWAVQSLVRNCKIETEPNQSLKLYRTNIIRLGLDWSENFGSSSVSLRFQLVRTDRFWFGSDFDLNQTELNNTNPFQTLANDKYIFSTLSGIILKAL